MRILLGKPLVLVIVTICGLLMPIKETFATSKPKPIPVFAWGMAEFGKDKPCMDSPYSNITMLYWLNNSNLHNVKQAKQYIDQQPQGRRAMFDWDIYRIMYTHPKDKFTTALGEKFTGLWWDYGVAEAEKRYDDFFREYKAIGGKLDYFILDVEHAFGKDVNKPEKWEVVEKDPRFKVFLKELKMNSAKDIYGIKRPFRFWSYSAYKIGQYTERLYQVVKKYFPEVKFSNYGAWYNKYTNLVPWGEWDKSIDVPGLYGFHVGTHQSPSLYGVVTFLSGNIVDDKKFGLGPFRSLIFSVNYARSAVLSSKVPFMPWIAWRGYVSDFTRKENPPPYCSYGNTDYYQESIFHTALCDVDTFLLWSAFRWKEDQAANYWCSDADLELFDNIVTQLNSLIGYNDRVTLVKKLAPWHNPYLLTGMKVNGQSIWRLTPDPTQSPVKLDAIKKSDNPLTFSIGKVKLIMPGAKIYSSGKELSSVGYWIVGPSNLEPIEMQ